MLSYANLQAMGVAAVLSAYSGLSIVPDDRGVLILAGRLDFKFDTGKEIFSDGYDIKIEVPVKFPESLPRVWETGGRIPTSFHTNPGDRTLCLGADTALLLQVKEAPHLFGFVNSCVVPYLYGYSFYEKNGVLPFGELRHGPDGVFDYYMDLFGVDSKAACIDFLTLLRLKKRQANKHRCPCNSGKPLGRCHNRKINFLRNELGRDWFQKEEMALRKTDVAFQESNIKQSHYNLASKVVKKFRSLPKSIIVPIIPVTYPNF